MFFLRKRIIIPINHFLCSLTYLFLLFRTFRLFNNSEFFIKSFLLFSIFSIFMKNNSKICRIFKLFYCIINNIFYVLDITKIIHIWQILLLFFMKMLNMLK